MAQSCVAMAGIASSLLHPSISSPSLLTPHTHTRTPPPPQCLPPLPSLHACLTPPSHPPPPSPTRRSFLPLLLASSAPALLFTKEAHAAASSIKIQGPPPPSGGLPGTENADQARDVELPLKNRFYIQPLSPPEAAARAKESAKDIIGVKALIDKKAWPYVQNDLRLKASYLRFDLNTIVASKPKDERKALKSVIAKLFDTIDSLDYAARSKSVPNAEKYYAETVSILNDVLAKIS